MLYIQGIEKISVVDGSLASPAIDFAADSGNGIYRIGADNWALVVNGVMILELNSTGIVAGENLRIAIPATGNFDFNNGKASSIGHLYGSDTIGMILYGNTTATYATARDIVGKVLDTTGDAWIEVFKMQGGAGVTSATAPVGFHGTAVAQAAHIANPTDLATAITAINAILVALENKGLTANA